MRTLEIQKLNPAARFRMAFGAILWVGLHSLLVGHCMADTSDARPNVILLMADDLGWGDVGFNGNSDVLTPRMDAMASEGITLTRFYAQAPSCSPTRASCLSGRNGYRFGVIRANNGHLKPEEQGIAEILSEAGYATGHFGKWHLGTLTNELRDGKRGGTEKGIGHYAPPWENGYDVSFATESKVPTWNPMRRPAGAPNTYWDPSEGDVAENEQTEFETRYWEAEDKWATENLDGDDSRVIMDRVIPFVENAARDGEPFFASVWFHAPHLPVVAGPEYTRLYERFGDYRKHYYGCITAMDTQIGRLHDRLEQLGIADDTLILFCSDNGPETIDDARGEKAPGSAGPWRGAKRFLLEGGVRVPGFALWPKGLPAGSASALPICTSDYLPTLLKACGIEGGQTLRPLDGIEVLGKLRAGIEKRDSPIPFWFVDQTALIDDRFKLYSNDGGMSYQLFDLESDPRELEDISAAHPGRADSMARQLAEWMGSCRESAEGADYAPR